MRETSYFKQQEEKAVTMSDLATGVPKKLVITQEQANKFKLSSK